MTGEELVRRRMHGLYLTRPCPDLETLARDLLGLHSWFARNVAFSGAIRGAELFGWKTALTKTWLYRGTLHGAVYEELPLLLALHAQEGPWSWLGLSTVQIDELCDKVLRLMEDGVCSRAQMRRIFRWDYDPETLGRIFSPWGGIFVYLAKQGRVAFQDMTSRDFDLIAAEPTLSPAQALPELARRYFTVYGPATRADAALFFGLDRQAARELEQLDLSDLERIESGNKVYYAAPEPAALPDIPRVQLLSGFDPLVVSYADREAVLPPEYRKAVILSSGICLPSVAVDGRVAGLWNVKKGQITLEFFTEQPRAVVEEAREQVERVRWQTGL